MCAVSQSLGWCREFLHDNSRYEHDVSTPSQSFKLPTRIAFGDSALSELLDRLAQHTIQQVLVKFRNDPPGFVTFYGSV